MNIKITSKVLLLAGLVSTVPMKILKKQPVQYADCIVDTVSFAKKPAKNILVADNFKTSLIDINGDFLSDVSHGFVTSTIIEQGLPNAKVVKCNIFPSSSIDKCFVVQSLDKLFSSVLKNMDEGKNFDAINLSIGFAVKYQDLSKEVGNKLNSENIASYAKKVKEVLQNKNEQFKIKSLPIKAIMGVIDKMDKISARGTKIYIAAGNSSDATLNLLALADDVEIVGAVSKKGKFVVYSDRNTLVKRFENGDVCSKVVDGGFDITDDGKLDVKKEETTALFNIMTPFAKLDGTSFATPRALVKDYSYE